ncbi:hypothetical protein KKG63_00350, partial [Patescibacteria group bacterium]|nr:hypothetical protein [Patescibacteria group bacterium]
SHCVQEELFLQQLETEYPTLSIHRFEVWGSAKNRTLLQKVGARLGADVSGVPFTVVGSDYVGGYYTDDTTGAQIRQYVANCVQNTCEDALAELTLPLPPSPTPKPQVWEDAPASLPREVNFPLVGKVNLTTLSLPAIAVILGTLDGFNPCAMWVLLFLISLLINLPNRRRRWLLGLTFLFASGLVYFLFMAAWLNLLLFLGLVVWIRLGIALFAIIAGLYSLQKFRQHQSGCVVANNQSHQRIFGQLKKFTAHQHLPVALLGIAGLAFAVNLVELLCSAGFPAIFTQVLSLNRLPTLQYYLYIGLYILFFVLDDLIIFFLAMRTLEVTGISTKYAKYSHLLGGLLMMIIGALLILKPDYLMFTF